MNRQIVSPGRFSLFEIKHPEVCYEHFLHERDIRHYRNIVDLAQESGVHRLFLGGSAPEGFVFYGKKEYNDVDILATIAGPVFSNPFAADLRLAATTRGGSPILLGKFAYEINHHPILAAYVSTYTGTRKETFELRPIKDLSELKSGLLPAPIHLSFISESDFNITAEEASRRLPQPLQAGAVSEREKRSNQHGRRR